MNPSSTPFTTTDRPAAAPLSEADAQRWMLGYLGRLSSTTAQHETSAPLAPTAPFDPTAGPFSALSAYCAAHADPPSGCDEIAAEAERQRYLPALRRAVAGRGRVVLGRTQLPDWTMLLVGPLIDATAEHIGLDDVVAVIIDTLWGQRCQVQHEQMQEEGWCPQAPPSGAAADETPATPPRKRRCTNNDDPDDA